MKKTVSFTIDEETLEELDNFGEKMGLTRSAAMNMLLRGVLLNESMSLLKAMASAAKESKQEKGASNEEALA